MKSKSFIAMTAGVLIVASAYLLITSRRASGPTASVVEHPSSSQQEPSRSWEPATSPATSLTPVAEVAPNPPRTDPEIGRANYLLIAELEQLGMNDHEITQLTQTVSQKRRELYGELMKSASIEWEGERAVYVLASLPRAEAARFKSEVVTSLEHLLGKDRTEVLLESTESGRNVAKHLENFGSYQLGFRIEFDAATIDAATTIRFAKQIEDNDPRTGIPYAYTTIGSVSVEDFANRHSTMLDHLRR